MQVIHNEEIQTITFLDERFYQSPETGNWYPSNTTITDIYPKGFGFTQWLKDLGSNADEALKRAGDQGTHIHDMIEDFLLGEEIKWSEGEDAKYTLDEWLMFLKFIEFYKVWKPVSIAVETKLVSDKLGFGTRLDYVCTIPAFPGDVWYIDWKSGSGIYKGHKLQAAAAQAIWNEQQKEKITRIGLLHLRAQTRGVDKTSKSIQGKGWKIEEVAPDEQAKTYRLFEYTKEIWKEENPNPMPKNMVYPDRMSLEILREEKEKNK